MVLPLIALGLMAGGAIAQDQAKRKSIKSQRREVAAQERQQRAFRDVSRKTVLDEAAQTNPLAAEQQDLAAGSQVQGTTDDQTARAQALFNGPAGDAGAAISDAGTASRAFSTLEGGRLGAAGRRRLGRNFTSDRDAVSGRAQRAALLYQALLDRAARSGQGLYQAGSLMSAAGGGMLSGSMLAPAAAGGAGSLFGGGYTQASPGAADLYGRQRSPYA